MNKNVCSRLFCLLIAFFYVFVCANKAAAETISTLIKDTNKIPVSSLEPASINTRLRSIFLAGPYQIAATKPQSDVKVLVDPPATTSTSTEPTKEPENIEDNSFLIEEAYNQDRGIIQHINTFMYLSSGEWIYTLTQEFPAPNIRHQLSYTLPIQSTGDDAGIGDLAINYRYQLSGANGEHLLIAPRFTLLVPSGNSRKGLGAGGAGFQFNLPITIEHCKKFVTHWNIGTTVTPRAKNEFGEKATTTGLNLGQSMIWLIKPTFNLMLETIWTRSQGVTGPDSTENIDAVFINPGIRWAHNLKNGFQIVPGIAAPIGVGPSRGKGGVFLYLSLER